MSIDYKKGTMPLMERLLLPQPKTRTAADAVILQWHVEEGTPLARHAPLITVQIGAQTRQYFFAWKGQGLVVKKLALQAGERMGRDRTLALVGTPGERLPESIDIEAFPPVGTGAFMNRWLTYFRFLRGTLFCVGLLFALNLWIGAVLDIQGRAAAGILLALQKALDVILPLSLGCLFAPIFISVTILVLFLTPPEPWRVLKSRRLPASLEQQNTEFGSAIHRQENPR